MNNVFKALAQIAASKIVGGLFALGVSVGVVIPLNESASLTATLTLAIAAVLQMLWQIVLAWAEKRWPKIADFQPLVLRVRLRSYSVRNVR